MLSYFTPAGVRAGEDRYTIGAVRARLAHMPAQDLDLATRTLTRELEAFNHLVAPGSRYLPVLELFHSHVEGLLPRLQARLDNAAPPLTHVARQHARAADQLLKELASAYRNTLMQGHGLLGNLLRKRELHMPLVRTIDLLSRRLVLSYRLYSRPPKGVWQSLHELFVLARRLSIAKLDLNAPHTNPEALYRKTLLLALADPSRLSGNELRRTREYIARFGDVARFHGATASSRTAQGLFYIDFDSDRPGIPLSRMTADKRPRNGLLLSTRALLKRLVFQYDRLSFGSNPAQLGLPTDPDPRHYRDFIRRLGTAWRGLPRSRAQRLRFHPRAEIFSGFPAAWAQLQAHEQQRASGELRTGPSTPDANEWAILNESPQGYALRYLSGSVGAARVGDLVVIRTRDRGHVFPCLVRWVRSEPGENLEIGLQQLLGKYEPATFRRAQGRHYGQIPILASATPDSPRLLTVLAPSRLLGLRQEIVIRRGSTETRHTVRRLVESTTFADLVETEESEGGK
jgi:hypothetical protein